MKTCLGIVLIHHTKIKYLGQYSTAIILRQLYINALFLTQFLYVIVGTQDKIWVIFTQSIARQA